MTRKVALYLRVSTKEQTTENQRQQLEQVCKAAGWSVVSVYEDAGIVGKAVQREAPVAEQNRNIYHRTYQRNICPDRIISVWNQAARGYDGQGSHLAHIPTGSTTAARYDDRILAA